MVYAGFLFGQIVLVVVCFSYWMRPGRTPRTYLFERGFQHLGDAGLSLFVLVAWLVGWLDILAAKVGVAEAGKLPDAPTTLATGFVAGGVCGAASWAIHSKWRKKLDGAEEKE